MADTAIFDVDGTLVDSNYHHAIAWSRALRRHQVIVPLWRLHRAIGMGGDRLVAEVAGAEVEHRLGDRVREDWVQEFDALVGEVAPLRGARELLSEVKDRGFRLVLASSGRREHVEAFLDLLDARGLADGWTTSQDASQSKPAPDLLTTALTLVGGSSGVMVGDSVFDGQAASRLGMPTIAVRTGGFSVGELLESGALQVFDSLTALCQALDGTALSSCATGGTTSPPAAP